MSRDAHDVAETLDVAPDTFDVAPDTDDVAPASVCGDGAVEGAEQCDDGNADSGDGCTSNCSIEQGWQCDGEPTVCTTFCGDGVAAGEEGCDDGQQNSDTLADACRTDCTLPSCGDGVLDTGEECDDASNNSDTLADICRSTCLEAYCGDGVLDTGEECDDGAANSDTAAGACRSDCREPFCGDGVADSGEACDDGNQQSGDGCDATCNWESGAVRWLKNYSAAGQGWSTAVDASGNIYLTGVFGAQSVDFGGGPLVNAGGTSYSSDIFLVKFDGNGQHIWSKSFGGFATDRGYSVEVDSQGSVYLAGSFSRTNASIDFGGGPMSSTGTFDAFLAKFDSAGNHLWSKGFGGGKIDEARLVAVDSADNVYLYGDFESDTINFSTWQHLALSNTDTGSKDIFIAKFDSSGQHIWSKKFGGATLDDVPHGLAFDSADNVYMTGEYGSYYFRYDGNLIGNDPDFNDAFLVKIDSAGNYLWSKSYGGGSFDETRDVVVDSLDHVYLTGTFRSTTIDFGGGSLTNANAGRDDTVLVKLDSSGNHIWSQRFGSGGSEQGRALAVDASDNVYVTGTYSRFFESDYTSTPLDLGGGAFPDPGTDPHIFAAKFNAAGAHQWSHAFSGGKAQADCLTADGSSTVYMTGYFFSSLQAGPYTATSNAPGRDVFLMAFEP